jgi:hypothetical protein
LVDVVSKPAQHRLELPFLVQNVIFEPGEKLVVVPVGSCPLATPSQAREKTFNRRHASQNAEVAAVCGKKLLISIENKSQVLSDP